MKPDLLILSATALETSHFLNLYPSSSQRSTKTGITLLSGKLNDNTYDLLITGPGVFNTSHALSAYLEHSTPSLIIQMGVAGIFEQAGLNIGDITIATQSHYIHTGIGTDSIEKTPLPFDLIKSDPLTRIGLYTFDSKEVEACYKMLVTGSKETTIKVSKGLIITVSSITSSKAHADKLYMTYSPVMEAMEGAAGLHVATLYKVPIVEIRSASNFAGERDKSKWELNLAIKHLGLALSCLK
jgi:futalosine hydrolase